MSPPAVYRRVDSPPSFLIALETFTPPPPGSMVGALQRSFLSGTTNSTLELLSIVGLMAKETIPFMMIPPINVARVI